MGVSTVDHGHRPSRLPLAESYGSGLADEAVVSPA